MSRAELLAAGGNAVGAEALEWLRIYRGVPRYGGTISLRNHGEGRAVS